MQDDFISSLGYKGFTARMKRISDKLMYDARDHYAKQTMEIEPNWHLVLLLLKEKKALTVTEIANQLKFSHPAVIKITKKMKDLGYLVMETDDADSRKKVLTLSNMALEKLPKLEEEWGRIEAVIEQLIDDHFMEGLHQLEDRLFDKGLNERYNTLK